MEQHPTGMATQASPLGRLYKTSEVATMLRVAQRTVEDWIRSGQLKGVRYGRLLRVREADLTTFGEVLQGHSTAAVHAGEATPL